MQLTTRQTELKHEMEGTVHALRLFSGRCSRANLPFLAMQLRDSASALERCLQTQVRLITHPESMLAFDVAPDDENTLK